MTGGGSDADDERMKRRVVRVVEVAVLHVHGTEPEEPRSREHAPPRFGADAQRRSEIERVGARADLRVVVAGDDIELAVAVDVSREGARDLRVATQAFFDAGLARDPRCLRREIEQIAGEHQPRSRMPLDEPHQVSRHRRGRVPRQMQVGKQERSAIQRDRST
jgi:hypothetical protein